MNFPCSKGDFMTQRIPARTVSATATGWGRRMRRVSETMLVVVAWANSRVPRSCRFREADVVWYLRSNMA